MLTTISKALDRRARKRIANRLVFREHQSVFAICPRCGTQPMTLRVGLVNINRADLGAERGWPLPAYRSIHAVSTPVCFHCSLDEAQGIVSEWQYPEAVNLLPLPDPPTHTIHNFINQSNDIPKYHDRKDYA